MWKREFLAAVYDEVRQGTSVTGSRSLARVGRGVRERARCLCERKEDRETIYEAGSGNLVECSKQASTK